jgi:hypothetical protein
MKATGHRAFAERLKAALRSAKIEPRASVVEKLFNSRYPTAQVTSQTVSGWLNGRYKPTDDKIEVLAKLVGVEPHVLHYGDNTQVAEAKVLWPTGAGVRERHTIEAFLALPARKRDLVGELVAALGEGGGQG